MWSKLVLCLCVGLALTSKSPAWRENSEYHYLVHGRTLTSLHEISDQYSGIAYRAALKIQSRDDGNLQARISDCQYSQIQQPLSNGWNSHLPDSELPWKPLIISPEPFQILLEDGAVKGVVVNKGISNWEVNMIKGIVSQFQLKINERSSSEEDIIPFRVMEETITGNTETYYKINRMPEQMVIHEPSGERLMEEKRDGEVYEVVKQKNYTNSVELPSYFYGFADLDQGLPATNRMGTFLTRNSFSRTIFTGKPSRFTIQKAFTVSEILVNPTLTDKERGSVYSMVNITLEKMEQQREKIQEVPNPLHLNSLVYSYGNPYHHSNQASGRISSESVDKHQMPKYQTDKNLLSRLRRSLEQSDILPGSEESYKHNNQELHEAPESPLLRYTEGYQGQSIKQKIDVVQKVKELVQEIAKEFQHPTENLEKETLTKFTILTALLRVMNANEMKVVGAEFHGSARSGQEGDAWKVYRDAVSECGTGPAFLTIQEWIQLEKIQGFEAGYVVATMTRAARQPSVHYIKTYFELIKNQKILSEWPLNDTAILSFSQLVRQVYVDKRHSASQYPVKSFRNFRNEEGLQLLKEAVIPYFTEQLHRAISQAQTHKIHVYIRALGNIGSPQILTAFEPYFEGHKQASQFQRLLMVLALDRLAETYPEQARSALMRLYQNNGDSQKVRVAAVYQIIRTKPSAELLQYMASYTNIDKDEHVNAAVKSSIETIAELRGQEFQELRQAAEAAKPLLTKRTFGVQFGANYLHQHVIEELKMKYKDSLQLIGSEDEFFPNGLKSSLYYTSAGLRKKLFNVQAMVSSIHELIHVFNQQTSSYSKKLQQQKENHQQQIQYQWSSQKIADFLGLQPEEREQLEGNLYFENGAAEVMIGFDNGTIHKLIKELGEFESDLESGKQVNFLKMTNAEELAIAFPTEMGLPFLYTYDTPSVLRIQGHVKASANPKISREELTVPDHAQIDLDLSVTMTSKVQGRISFITPFDHQQYVSGYKKHSHFNLPIKGKFEVDTKKMRLRAEFEMDKSQKPTVLYHYGSTPYISREDILKCEPSGMRSHETTRFIAQNEGLSFEQKFGEKLTGLAFRVKVDKEKPLFDVSRMKYLYNKDGEVAALAGLWNDVSIQRSDITVLTLPQDFSTEKIEINFGYESRYRSNPSSGQNSEGNWDKQQQERWQSANAEERQTEALEKVGRGIRNSKSRAMDVSVEFVGEQNIKYTMNAAYSKSNIDSRSRITFKYRSQSNRQEEEPFMIALQAESDIENTNSLDLEYAMRHEPKMKGELQLAFGYASENPTTLRSEVQFQRSDERKQYLKEQPMYKQCRSEMRDGDNQLPACANVTIATNLFDRVNAKLQYENVPEELREVLKTLYYAAQYRYYPIAEFDRNQKSGRNNELSLQAKFDPDLRSLNVSVASQKGKLTLHSIPLNEFIKEAIVVHPVFHAPSRVMATALGLHAYRPMCVVDQTKISTFNNLTYPAEVSDKWTVMFQYIPKEARFEEYQGSIQGQLKHQIENYVVFVKAEGKGRKVKIALNTPETKFQVVDVTMTPRQQQTGHARVIVNEKDVKVDQNKSYDFEEGYIQIYGLPNGEIKAEVRDQFYVIYDGNRVKLTVLNGKFRDATTGVCGQFNDEKTEEFLTPENCFVQDRRKFIRSYEVEGSQGQEVRQKLKSENMQCIRKTVPLYVDVVTAANIQSWQQQGPEQCTAFQTQYVHENGHICFTIRPMPKCAKGCQPSSHIERNVPVHCVQKSSVAQLWKNQIDNGKSPDFSQKSESKRVSIQIPQNCA